MDDARTGVALDASNAAAAMARRRWGDTRVRSLVAELAERKEQLGPELLGELRELVGDVVDSTEES